MAVPIEFTVVIVRRSTLDERFPGGVSGYAARHGNGSLAMDDHLVGVGFMGATDVERLLKSLELEGLVLVRDDAFADVAIVTVIGGLTLSCDWLEYDRGRCWLAGTDPGEVVERASQIEERRAPGPVGRSLLGLAIGDCLGAGVEGWSAADIRQAHTSTAGYVRSFAYDPMVWTDDTQQALTLIEATARFGFPEPTWVADRWVEMSDRGIHRGTGRGFRAAIDTYRTTGDLAVSGRSDRAGNGAAMRIAPTAVALRELSDDDFVRHLVAVSLVTHREGRALAGMLAVAFVTRALAEGFYPPRKQRAKAILTELVPWLRDREVELEYNPTVVLEPPRTHEISEAFDGLTERIDEGWPTVAEWIVGHATECRGEPTGLGEGFVTASVVTAVAWTIVSGCSLPTTLTEAVGFGDDTDTVAAMCGGMAGTGAPRETLRPGWQGFAGRDELLTWAKAVDAGADVDGLPDVLGLEDRLTGIRYA